MTKEDTNLQKQLTICERALEDLAKQYSKLFCLYYCNKEIDCTDCENGDYKFIMNNVIQKAKDDLKE